MGHGRGSRPRTYNHQTVPGGPENQSKIVLSLGFYHHPRLTPIGLFAFSSRKRVGIGKERSGAPTSSFRICVFRRGNVGKSETAKFFELLCGHVQPGDAPWGLPGPAWWPSRVLLKASQSLPGSQNMHFSNVFHILSLLGASGDTPPCKSASWGELRLTP